ncbi:MAG: hypothetical protein ACK51B_02660, partial [bacterium]
GSSQVQEVPPPPACRGAFETVDWQACADAAGQGTPAYALAMINLGTRAYIDMLKETAGKSGRETIYIPTEAGMPVLEAGRVSRRQTE